MRQPKDFLTVVNLARRTELADRTIADGQSNLNNCKENPFYTSLHYKLREDLTDEIEPLRKGFPSIFQIVIEILRLLRSLIPAGSHLSAPPATNVD